MFTMILPAHTISDFCRTDGKRRLLMTVNDRKKSGKAEKAVAAYNAQDRRFDPLGSYTGKCPDGKPQQDADDL